MGYHTVLSDYLPDNPGQYIADSFYPESTTNIPKILEIARREQIDAIVSFASDVAAPTAAYVAEKINLRGNPFSSVDALCQKTNSGKCLRQMALPSPIL